MIIRTETHNDYDKIYDLVKTAFETANFSDGDEQDFVVELRESGKYIPELALVAEEDGCLIGHIMLTKLTIKNGEKDYHVLLLAPLCVLLEHRCLGVGAQLVGESFKRAREMGYDSVLLAGDPDYYGRFGFSCSEDYGIINTSGVPAQYTLACELVPGALSGKSGTVSLI